jgi:hypothetical protein
MPLENAALVVIKQAKQRATSCIFFTLERQSPDWRVDERHQPGFIAPILQRSPRSSGDESPFAQTERPWTTNRGFNPHREIADCEFKRQRRSSVAIQMVPVVSIKDTTTSPP